MSYTLVKAVVLPYALASQWEEIDLSSKLVKVIFANYKEISLTLLRGGEEVFVDFNQLRPEYATYNNTLPVLLQALGSRQLEEMEKIPFRNFRYARYTDSLRVGYKTQLVKRGVAWPDEYPRSEKTDLLITRPDYNTDLTMLHTHCLVSVNGILHQTDTDGTHAFAVDGGKTVQIGNYGHVGLTSFVDIGKLEKLSFDEASISTPDASGKLWDMVGFTTDVDLTDKSVMLSLGGYLVLPQDQVFWQNGENEFRLNLRRLPYLERIQESRNFIDISSLGLTESELNPANLNIKEVTSNEVIKKYFGLSQSFLIVIDRKDVFTNKIALRQSMLPGLFTAYQEPTYPLIVGHGRMAEYWKVQEGGYWAVNAQDTWYRRYTFSQQSVSGLVNVSDQLSFDRPYFDSKGILLEIGVSVLVG